MFIIKKYKKIKSIALSFLIICIFLSSGVFYNYKYIPEGKSEVLIYLGTYGNQRVLNPVYIKELIYISSILNNNNDCINESNRNSNILNSSEIDHIVLKLTHYSGNSESSLKCIQQILEFIEAEEKRYFMNNFLLFNNETIKNKMSAYKRMQIINDPIFTSNPEKNKKNKTIFLMLILGILTSIYLWRKI